MDIQELQKNQNGNNENIWMITVEEDSERVVLDCGLKKMWCWFHIDGWLIAIVICS